MIELPYPSLPAWKAVGTTFHVLAILFTIVRFGLRRKTSRLWWDDYITIIPVLATIVLIYSLYNGYLEAGKNAVDTMDFSADLRQNTWLGVFPLLTVLWGSRISIAVSFLRIFSPLSKQRKLIIGLISLFCLFYTFLVIFYFSACKNSSFGTKVDGSQCLKFTKSEGIAPLLLLILDMVGDLLLVIYPIYMLWHVKLPQAERKFIMALFSSSVITMLFVIVNLAFFYGKFVPNLGYILAMPFISHLESAVALIVCNLLVVVGYFYKITRRNRQAAPVDGDDSEQSKATTYEAGAVPRNSKSATRASVTLLPEVDHRTHDIPLKTMGDDLESLHERKG